MKVFRDNEKCWEELKELKKKYIITEIKEVQKEITGLKNAVQSLTNRTNLAEEGIPELEDNQN